MIDLHFRLKNDEKNICLRIIFLLLHIYRRQLSLPVRKMCPIPDVPLMDENMIFSNKMFEVLIFEKIHNTESYINLFVVNIWNHGKKLQDLSGQIPCRNG